MRVRPYPYIGTSNTGRLRGESKSSGKAAPAPPGARGNGERQTARAPDTPMAGLAGHWAACGAAERQRWAVVCIQKSPRTRSRLASG